MNPLVEAIKKNKEKIAVSISTSDVDKFLAMFEHMVNAVKEKTAMSEPDKEALKVETQESHA